MADYWGLIMALAIGVPLLLLAVLVDRRARRRREGEIHRAPERGNPDIDVIVPAYVTQSEVDAMPHPAGPANRGAPPGGHVFAVGHLASEFATDGDACELADAHVLLVDGEVDAMRQLLVPLSKWSPLVVLARGFHDDVTQTLVANRKATRKPVVAVRVSSSQLEDIQGAVGGHLLDASDLRAGYVPESFLGYAVRWRSTLTQIRLEPREG